MEQRNYWPIDDGVEAGKARRPERSPVFVTRVLNAYSRLVDQSPHSPSLVEEGSDGQNRAVNPAASESDGV